MVVVLCRNGSGSLCKYCLKVLQKEDAKPSKTEHALVIFICQFLGKCLLFHLISC